MQDRALCVVPPVVSREQASVYLQTSDPPIDLTADIHVFYVYRIGRYAADFRRYFFLNHLLTGVHTGSCVLPETLRPLCSGPSPTRRVLEACSERQRYLLNFKSGKKCAGGKWKHECQMHALYVLCLQL